MLKLPGVRKSFTQSAMWVLIPCFLAAVFPSGARAQRAAGTASQVDVSLDYSYIRANAASGANSSNLQGGSASVAYNFRGHWGVVGDFGGSIFTGQPAGLSAQMYTYLFGPRYTIRRSERFAPYAQVLLGGGRLNASAGPIQAGENAFAMTLGGGVDINLNHRFAIRAVQAEYLLTRFANAAAVTVSQNNFRISAGIVIRIGTR
jgi:opacity protein-like surface antigen